MNLIPALKYLGKNSQHLKRYVGTKKNTLRYYLPGYQSSFFPQTVYIVLNNRCNLKCRMCDVGTHTSGTSFFNKLVKNKNDFDLHKLKHFIDSIESFKPFISLTSTEPLLYKDLGEITRYIKRKHLALSITTNGYLLPQYAEEIVANGVDNIIISLDGLSKVHNGIRGVKDSFEKALAGLEELEIFKKRRNSRYPLVFINYTISESNYSNLVDFLDFMRVYDIAFFTFSHLNFVTAEMAEAHNRDFGHIGHSSPTCVHDIEFGRIDCDVLFSQISRIKKEKGNLPVIFSPDFTNVKGIYDYYNSHSHKFGNRTCFVPWKYSQILSNGDVTVLTRCFDVVFGNVFEERFVDIWNGPRMKRFREALKTHGYFPACLRCCGLF